MRAYTVAQSFYNMLSQFLNNTLSFNTKLVLTFCMVTLNHSNVIAMVKIIRRYSNNVSRKVIHKLVDSTRNKTEPRLSKLNKAFTSSENCSLVPESRIKT